MRADSFADGLAALQVAWISADRHMCETRWRLTIEGGVVGQNLWRLEYYVSLGHASLG